jgi:diacylglycerol kinase
MALKRFARSLAFAVRGLSTALREQPNLRIHLGATVTVGALGAALGIAPVEWMFVATAVALVWVSELLNTAIEYATDLAACDAQHDLAAKAKDVAAGAVLAAALYAITVAVVVFGSRLWIFLQIALYGKV